MDIAILAREWHILGSYARFQWSQWKSVLRSSKICPGTDSGEYWFSRFFQELSEKKYQKSVLISFSTYRQWPQKKNRGVPRSFFGYEFWFPVRSRKSVLRSENLSQDRFSPMIFSRGQLFGMTKIFPIKTLKNPTRILMELNYNTKIKSREKLPGPLEPRTDFINQNIPKSVLGQILGDLEEDDFFKSSPRKNIRNLFWYHFQPIDSGLRKNVWGVPRSFFGYEFWFPVRSRKSVLGQIFNLEDRFSVRRNNRILKPF